MRTPAHQQKLGPISLLEGFVMGTAAGTNHRVRFRAFELDLRTRELFKNGTRVRLQGHPIDVLEMLLDRPGEMVTREELRRRLWPEHTFVDFEHSVNSTIARLRDALGDHAEDPKYIETLPRLGYRFVAEVENPDRRGRESGSVGNAAGAASPVRAEVVPISGDQPRLSIAPAALSPVAKPRRWLWILAGLVVAASFSAIWMVWFSVPPTLVVTSIEPLTHDGLPKYNPKTDGRRIYFVEFVDGRDLLSEISVAGGDISRIASPFANTSVFDVAPDGSKLLVSEPSWNEVLQTFWILPQPSGSPVRLGDLEGNYAAWSLDGRRMIFTKLSELWAAGGDGTNPRKLLSASGVVWFAQFSPDSERIRYVVRAKGRSVLWESGAEGSGAHPLLRSWHTAENQFGGVWAPDGRYYAFVEAKGNVSNIWIMREARPFSLHRDFIPAQLTQGPLSFDYLSFSSDGRTLFARGVLPRGELVRFDPQTRQVSPFLSGISAGDVAFSHDGEWLAYITYPDEILWRCRIDGSERRQLTTSGEASSPEWSPDDENIAFVKAEWGKPNKIVIVPKDGGNGKEADEEDWNEADANWSPDGTKMIFGAEAVGAKGSEIRELDLKTHKVVAIPGSEGFYEPRWSPDGSYLAAVSANTQRLMLFDFRRKLWSTWITDQEVNSQSIAFPVWSSDGRFLYFGSLLSRGAGDVEEWRARLGSHLVEKILDLHHEPRYPGGRWGRTSIGPDGTVYFTRDRNYFEIYALHLSKK
jgi:Tol biopolymer transport system component/DNA-binding winged helix-turn-helix (wHTH) protein